MIFSSHTMEDLKFVVPLPSIEGVLGNSLYPSI